ncbi:MAG: GatB/YqeY domain-containing protein, partial [Nitrospina sp.]|nr:GatB/YqeY domain-containing protein [Nitrospina sp.]
GMKDFGKIMKTLVPEFKGKADNALIKDLANEYLN